MAASLAAGLFFYSSCTPAEKTDTKDYTQYVNTFIGGADNGHTFPRACYPFGMIQTSPVTGAVGWRYRSEYVYEDGTLFVCPECSYEWSGDTDTDASSDELIVKDANGTTLSDGDSITVIKDLKVKGSSLVVKIGTKVKNIRLVEGDHNIDCKIDGIGPMKLKSEFVKKI